MKTSAFIALLLLSGCVTGTSFAERCVAYRAALAGLDVSQANNPSDARAARIAAYRALVDTCP